MSFEARELTLTLKVNKKDHARLTMLGKDDEELFGIDIISCGPTNKPAPRATEVDCGFENSTQLGVLKQALLEAVGKLESLQQSLKAEEIQDASGKSGGGPDGKV